MQFNRDAINNATAAGRRSKLDQNGVYACQVDRITTALSFKAGGGESYVIEMTVLESDNPNVKVGQERSITINRLDSKVPHEVESAYSNLKAFLAAAGCDLENEYISDQGELEGDPDGWSKLAQRSLDQEEQMFRGAKLRISIERVSTEKSKKAAERGDKYDHLLFARATFKPYNLSLIPTAA